MDDKKNYPRIMIAGTQSGVGKTIVTLGISSVLKKRGFTIGPFKSGPDYIDTAFHWHATGRPCRNLDSYLLDQQVLCELFTRQAECIDFSVVEGAMGLYDGAGIDGARGSSANVALSLRLPVILVVDVGKMAHSAAAMVLGYLKYDDDLKLAGCIVNRVASQNHYAIVKNAIECKTGVPVLGYILKDDQLKLPERHLGLQPVQEIDISEFMNKLASIVEETIDIDAVIRIGRQADSLERPSASIFEKCDDLKKIRIAYADDACFHFYYQDNLDILKHYGAELVPFSPIKDSILPPDLGGVYIGGGFPEIFAQKLAHNSSMYDDIKLKSRRGMPIYAECGGLIYLMKEIVLRDGKTYPMAGIFPGTVKMGDRLQTFGYHEVCVKKDTILALKAQRCKGHVFHWSYVTRMPNSINRAFMLERAQKNVEDGYMQDNTLASYIHIHFGSDIRWAKRFIQTCSNYKRDYYD